jgi:hypothetical protein
LCKILIHNDWVDALIITESLAKGLMHRFFDEAQDMVNKGVDALTSHAETYKSSKSGWIKYISKIKPTLNKLAISQYEGGSKGSPYIAFVGLSLNQERKFNSWNERCLTGETIIHVHKPMYVDTSTTAFNVGEHAVSRLYERGKVKLIDEFTVDIHSIFPEFQMLPLWSAFWVTNLAVMTNAFSDNFLPHFYHPVVPALSGIFLGELTHTRYPKLEIRTFVDDKNLSEDQLKLKKVMLEIGKVYQSSPLAMFPISGKVESDYYVNFSILSELSEHVELITRSVFGRNQNVQFESRAKENFKRYFSSIDVDRGKSISKIYREIGVREAQLIIKKEILKNGW